MLRRVKLKKGARTEGLERGIDLGLFTDPNQDVRGKDASGETVDLDSAVEIEVNNREYHRLKSFGLIEIEDTRLLAPAADQPEVDQAKLDAQRDLMVANAEQRKGTDEAYEPDLDAVSGPVHTERGPSGTDRGVHPGGVGHQEGETTPASDEDKSPARAQRTRGARSDASKGK